MRRFLLLLVLTSVGTLSSHAARLQLFQWREGKLALLGETPLSSRASLSALPEHLSLTIEPQPSGPLQEWRVKVANRSEEVERLLLRIVRETKTPGGNFWDGYTLHPAPKASVEPVTKRYRFPAVAYWEGDTARVAGFAPQTLNSRFERAWHPREGGGLLVWDAYLALHPGQEDEQTFITADLKDCRTYPEVVEAYHLAYPRWFRPVEGADSRLYGTGGFLRSREETRDIQSEEGRRTLLDWEWYYAPFQRAGAVVPDETTWDPSYGYNLEETQAIYEQKDGLEGWRAYNERRISAGNRTTGIYYYYLQQYAAVDLLKTRFTDSFWTDAKGNIVSPTFGWIKSGLWVQFAWPGETLYGKRLRADLASAWERFEISGYALDCVIGDIGYYGEALPRERGKAFDDDGKVFVVEGVAIARNLEFTHQLPPRPDGQRPASISNEPMTYHGIFYADAVMHEKPPYERADLLPLRRLMAGQKPFYWWSGSYRADSTLNWEELSREEFQDALQGTLDYVILTSLRYGGVPAVFLVTGYPQVRQWTPRIIELQRAGWRAAPYTTLPEALRPPLDDPYSEQARIWVSRYGSGEESWVALSSPKREKQTFPVEIATRRFSGLKLLYLDDTTGHGLNHASDGGTRLEVTLADHEPVILKAVAEVESPAPVEVELRRTGSRLHGQVLEARCPGEGWPEGTRLRFAGQATWQTPGGKAAVLRHETPPAVRFLPDESWVAEDLVSGEGGVAILITPEDRPALEARLLQLAHYREYYQMRLKAPTGALSSVHTVRDRKLAFPIVHSPQEEAFRNARTVFLLGEGARRLANAPASGQNDGIACLTRDGQRQVFVQPGTQDEAALWGELLSRLDEYYPFVGTMDNSPMHRHHQFGGTAFPLKPAR